MSWLRSTSIENIIGIQSNPSRFLGSSAKDCKMAQQALKKSVLSFEKDRQAAGEGGDASQLGFTAAAKCVAGC